MSAPPLSSEEALALFTGMNILTVVGVHNQAIIIVAVNVEDYFPLKKR